LYRAATDRSHPVKPPRLRFIVTYPIRSSGGLSFPCVGRHLRDTQDYFNASHEAALKRLVSDCFYYRPRCNLPPK
jgi:hypothetical protein